MFRDSVNRAHRIYCCRLRRQFCPTGRQYALWHWATIVMFHKWEKSTAFTTVDETKRSRSAETGVASCVSHWAPDGWAPDTDTSVGSARCWELQSKGSLYMFYISYYWDFLSSWQCGLEHQIYTVPRWSFATAIVGDGGCRLDYLELNMSNLPNETNWICLMIAGIFVTQGTRMDTLRDTQRGSQT